MLLMCLYTCTLPLLSATHWLKSYAELLVDKQIHNDVCNVVQENAVVEETRQGLANHECKHRRRTRDPTKNEHTQANLDRRHMRSKALTPTTKKEISTGKVEINLYCLETVYLYCRFMLLWFFIRFVDIMILTAIMTYKTRALKASTKRARVLYRITINQTDSVPKRTSVVSKATTCKQQCAIHPTLRTRRRRM